MRSLLIAALLAAGPALADDMVFQGDGFLVRLEPTACLHENVLDKIKPEHHGAFRHGYVIVRGKTLNLCWTVAQPGEITVIDQDGDVGGLPISGFKRAGGI
jgi:hypothetical protein